MNYPTRVKSVLAIGFWRWAGSMVIAVWGALGCVMASRLPTAAVPTPTPDTSGWRILAPGLEQRSYRPEGNLLGELYVLRIDPNLYTFRAHYRPGTPLNLSAWQNELRGAVAFVNANFFDEQGHILGMLVADGVVYGQSLVNHGGTFLVLNGQPRLRSNIYEPYAGELYEQAVQAFPMLLLNGQSVYNPARQEPVSRRTVVAQDRQGRVLLMATPLFGMSLEALSAFLPATDMGVVDALNLDGGGSTMLYVNSSPPARLPSIDPVPAVLAVYSR
jgi:hypothetical protein